MTARGRAHCGSRGALRVVSGTVGGRRLAAPAGDSTRPTPERVREAVFNALDSMGAITDAQVIDAFAGTGALGIEALSRGAAHATFVEAATTARAVVAANLDATGLAARATVSGGDGLRVVAGGRWDLVLLDPPYATDRWADLWPAVAGGLAPGGVAVAESDRELVLPTGLNAIRSKRYGSTVVTFVSPAGDPS